MKVIIRFFDNSGRVEFDPELYNLDDFLNSLIEFNIGVKSIEYKES